MFEKTDIANYFDSIITQSEIKNVFKTYNRDNKDAYSKRFSESILLKHINESKDPEEVFNAILEFINLAETYKETNTEAVLAQMLTVLKQLQTNKVPNELVKNLLSLYKKYREELEQYTAFAGKLPEVTADGVLRNVRAIKVPQKVLDKYSKHIEVALTSGLTTKETITKGVLNSYLVAVVNIHNAEIKKDITTLKGLIGDLESPLSDLYKNRLFEEGVILEDEVELSNLDEFLLETDTGDTSYTNDYLTLILEEHGSEVTTISKDEMMVVIDIVNEIKSVINLTETFKLYSTIKMLEKKGYTQNKYYSILKERYDSYSAIDTKYKTIAEKVMQTEMLTEDECLFLGVPYFKESIPDYILRYLQGYAKDNFRTIQKYNLKENVENLVDVCSILQNMGTITLNDLNEARKKLELFIGTDIHATLSMDFVEIEFYLHSEIKRKQTEIRVQQEKEKEAERLREEARLLEEARQNEEERNKKIAEGREERALKQQEKKEKMALEKEERRKKLAELKVKQELEETALQEVSLDEVNLDVVEEVIMEEETFDEVELTKVEEISIGSDLTVEEINVLLGTTFNEKEETTYSKKRTEVQLESTHNLVDGFYALKDIAELVVEYKIAYTADHLDFYRHIADKLIQVLTKDKVSTYDITVLFSVIDMALEVTSGKVGQLDFTTYVEDNITNKTFKETLITLLGQELKDIDILPVSVQKDIAKYDIPMHISAQGVINPIRDSIESVVYHKDVEDNGTTISTEFGTEDLKEISAQEFKYFGICTDRVILRVPTTAFNLAKVQESGVSIYMKIHHEHDVYFDVQLGAKYEDGREKAMSVSKHRIEVMLLNQRGKTPYYRSKQGTVSLLSKEVSGINTVFLKDIVPFTMKTVNYNFSDIAESPIPLEVEMASNLGIIQPLNMSTFYCLGKVTKEQAYLWIAKALGYLPKGYGWQEGVRDYLEAHGVLDGVTKEHFDLKTYLLRQELVYMLNNIFKVEETTEITPKDIDQISTEFKGSVVSAIRKDIVPMQGDGIVPKDSVSREEIAYYVTKIRQYILTKV